MFKTLSLTTGLLLSVITTVPSVSAYTYNSNDIGSAVITNALAGEHPYEKRKREEDLRKKQQEALERISRYRFDASAYYHPIFAKRSVLHPFFRKGGVSNYIDGRYSSWRGYQDPVQAQDLSPDTYCSNYAYQKLSHGSQPSNYQCF